MRDSLVFIVIFGLGIFMGIYVDMPKMLHSDQATTWLLYILLLFVGYSLGCDEQLKLMVKKLKFRYVLLPIIVIISSLLAGVILYTLNIDGVELRDALAISSGFGYYSLSSIMITNTSGSDMGVIALISNIFREILTLVFAPLMARYLSKVAPIVAGGATSMDTTLPFIVKYSGKEYTVLSLVNGIVLSLMVPVIITIIYNF